MIGKTLTLIAILASSIGFAQEANDAIDCRIIDEIVANKNTCVVGCSEDRIYLNPNRIFPTEQGLYLNLNDADYVLLPTLNSDRNGCYVAVLSFDILNTCPGCGLKYFVTWTNQNCPLVQKKQEREKEKERKKEEQKKDKKKK